MYVKRYYKRTMLKLIHKWAYGVDRHTSGTSQSVDVCIISVGSQRSLSQAHCTNASNGISIEIVLQLYPLFSKLLQILTLTMGVLCGIMLHQPGDVMLMLFLVIYVIITWWRFLKSGWIMQDFLFIYIYFLFFNCLVV